MACSRKIIRTLENFGFSSIAYVIRSFLAISFLGMLFFADKDDQVSEKHVFRSNCCHLLT